MAANILQAPTTRLYNVLLTLGNLFRIFKSASTVPVDISQAAIRSLERRWKDNADQELFILSIVFNPYIRNRCFNSSADRNLTPAGLCRMAESACLRILREEPGADFFAAFMSYLNEREDYAPDWMGLEQRKKLAEKAVSFA